MTNDNEIENYYNDLADSYDALRFGNSYGAFIHRQEERFLKKNISGARVLNMGCGTGRFMEFAGYGLDVSEAMIAAASAKFPKKIFTIGDAERTTFTDDSFDTVFCLHVFMHLEDGKRQKILLEAYRILKPDGIFICDFPSVNRRKLSPKKEDSWHGASAFSVKELLSSISTTWILLCRTGVLFLPVHRIPSRLRKYLVGIDNIFCYSPLKNYSSYLMVKLKKISS